MLEVHEGVEKEDEVAEMLMEGESCSFHELDSRGEILRLSSMARGRKLVHELEIGNCLEPVCCFALISLVGGILSSKRWCR